MSAQDPLLIRKASGDLVPFSEEKLRASLQRAGAGKAAVESVLAKIRPQLHSGSSTREIYRLAFQQLRSKARPTAARYRLKQGIMELGPTGFPFEKLVAALLAYQGWQVQTGQVLQGRCVRHEVDVLARKDRQTLVVECKYHNQQGVISNVKIPLYVQSRFLDLKESWQDEKAGADHSYQGMVATNTRFSADALQYGNCAGLALLAWDYPKGRGLKDLIDSSRIYPVTCLTSLPKPARQRLLDMDVVLARDLLEKPYYLEGAGVAAERKHAVLQELRQLCEGSAAEASS